MQGFLRKTFAILAFAAVVPVSALAADGPTALDGQGNGHRHGPPPQAYAACEGKQAGDTVQITTPRGDTLKAVCREIDGRLAAVPARKPGFGPPPDNRSDAQ